MRTRSPAVIAVLLLVARFAGAQHQGSSRDAFLKLIDRPRVEPAVVEKEAPAPAKGMVQSHVTFSSEAGQRVPFILIKPADAKPGARLPVVIALHGTGSKKESNLALLKRLTTNGFIGVSPDGRYHGERCAKGTGTDDYFAAIAQAYQDGKSHPWLYDTVYD